MSKSLAHRVGVLILLILAPMMFAFGFAAYSIGREELSKAFDSGLRTNAEAIATLTEIEPDGHLEVEFAPEIMPRYVRQVNPDVLAVYTGAGDLLKQSAALETVPDWVHTAASGVIRDFDIGGIPYRGTVLLSMADDIHEVRIADAPIRVFAGSARAPLDQALAHLRRRLTILLVLAILMATLLATIAAAASMRPLRAFAGTLDDVNPPNLGTEIDLKSLPLELRPPAAAINRLTLRLEEAFQREKNFSADAAHELRTPVGALLVTVQAALRSERSPEADTEFLRDLQDETNRLHQLCEALLALHANDGEEDACLLREEFVEALQSDLSSLAPLIEAARCSLDVRIEGLKGARLRCSHQAVHRIVGNLVANAIVHGGEGTKVGIEFSGGNGGAELVCVDDGAGIPSHLGDRVFDRLVRGDRSRARVSGGAGLGLTLSREMARRLGGDLVLDAEHSPGARFVWFIATAGK